MPCLLSSAITSGVVLSPTTVTVIGVAVTPDRSRAFESQPVVAKNTMQVRSMCNVSERIKWLGEVKCEWDNGNVHRDAGENIASKNCGAGGSVCNVLLSRDKTLFAD